VWYQDGSVGGKPQERGHSTLRLAKRVDNMPSQIHRASHKHTACRTGDLTPLDGVPCPHPELPSGGRKMALSTLLVFRGIFKEVCLDGAAAELSGYNAYWRVVQPLV